MNSCTMTCQPSHTRKAFPARGRFLAGLSLLTAMLCLSVRPAQALEMELEVSGLTHHEGRILVAVFADPAQWLKRPVQSSVAEASQQKEGRILIKLQDLPEGPLALSIFHDVNGNGKLDSNALGIPKEPYGFSNNAAGNFGPPKFEKAQFPAQAGARVSVQLN